MANDDSQSEPKNVRLFYCLSLRHSIPCDQGFPNNESEIDFCESLNADLEVLLEQQNFQIVFDRQTGVQLLDKKQRYLIPFLVSRVHEFEAKDIIIPKPGWSGFQVNGMAMSLVQEKFAQDVRNTVGANFCIHDLVFSMATSRGFAFEVYYEGSFRVRREFSDDEIRVEGGVRLALESFFGEIESAIKPFGFEVTNVPSTRKRSRNNEYLFDVYYAPVYAFSEGDVHGQGSYAVRGDASTDEINEYGIDFDFTDTLVDEANAALRSLLEEDLPPETDLVSCEIYYIDDSEEAYDVDDELIPSAETGAT